MTNNLINTLKINHSLDETTQNFMGFKSYLFLNEGTLHVVNRRPCLDKTATADQSVCLSEVKAMGAGSSLTECEDGVVYELSESGASTAVEDITGIVFGGMTSRFWIYRKHFSCLSYGQLENLPFHAWDCLTLQTKKRDIDLVLTDQKEMFTLIKYLIYQLRTIDGTRNSAKGVLDALLK